MFLIDWLIRKINKTCVSIVGESLAGDFRQDAYKNAVVRETVDAIARHAAKLHAVYMVGSAKQHGKMQYLIGERPNPFMSAYDMQYKLISQALMKNNSFALPVWDKTGELSAILPVDYATCEALQEPNTGEAFLRFQLVNGKETVLPYAELMHLRRHFSRSTLMGDGNAPLSDAVEMVNVMNAGMMSAIKAGSNLRGILKFKQAMLKDKDIQKRRDAFIADYVENGNGGIAGLDATMDYEQLDPSKMYSMTPQQAQEIRGNIYRYYGVTEKFVTGGYTEDDWNAIYEAVIEPFAVQLHMEYTRVLFTRTQRENGSNIVFEANRLQYASANTKIELVNRLGMLGLITYNEGREIFNMPPIANGEKLIPPWNSQRNYTSDKRGGNPT